MSAELITVWAFGLIFGLPLALIFWAHIYVMVRDIIAPSAAPAPTQGGQ